MATAEDTRTRVALITGGARGIGLAIAKGLALQGTVVYLADITRDIGQVPYPLAREADLARAEADLRRLQPRCRGLPCDVRDPADVHRVVSAIEAAEGRLDILVNNAAVLVLHPLEAVSDAEWAAQFDTIATGAFLCCRRALPAMRAGGWGRIVNIASVAGHRGIGTGVAYSAAKHALVGLTRALAMEVAGAGITVNAVCPGTVVTDLVLGTGAAQGWTAEETLARLSERHLGGGPVSPDDVAAAALWLASEAAGRVTGASLFVDDGWHAH